MNSKGNQKNYRPEVQFALTLRPTFPILALSGFVDTLRHAADDNNRNRQIYCGWSIVGHSLHPVPSSSGIEITPDVLFKDLEKPLPEYLVVIGGNVMSEINAVPEETLSFIRNFYAQGGTVIGLCTGSFVVAQTGLIDGKRVVVHHRHRRDFLDRYDNVNITSREVFVEDQRVITCPGGTASIDLAIELLSRKLGRTRALKGLIEMSVDQHRSSFHMPRTPSDGLDSCGDWRVETAVKLMRENMSSATTVGTIAEDIGISTSQLGRLFKQHAKQTPVSFWINLRLDHARWRLLNSNLSLTQIAFECGFADAAHFCRQFKRRFKQSPKSFKNRMIANEQSDFSSSTYRAV